MFPSSMEVERVLRMRDPLWWVTCIDDALFHSSHCGQSLLPPTPTPHAWLSHVTWFDQWVVSTRDGWHSRGWKSAYALGLLSCNNHKNTPELLGGVLHLKHGPILPHPSWGHDDNHESPAESSQPTHSWPDAWAGPTEIGRKTQMTHRPRSNNAYINKYLHNY